MTTQGRRVEFDAEIYPYEIEARLAPGEYAKCLKFPEVGWILCTPNGDMGCVRPPVFTIEEHDDGTITVGPASIQVYKKDGGPGWHGYLHHGVWTTA